MEQGNDMFRVITQISEEQRIQLYTLLEKFETECEDKNSKSKLPAKVEEKSIFQKLWRLFKKHLINLRKQQNSKSIAMDILDGKRENSKLFMLCQGDKIVGFEMAQISKEQNDKIVGWKPWMYIQKEFRNTEQEFINEKGEKKVKNATLQLDENVEHWFSENNVNYQKTSTGINMLPNIVTYIRLGFKPVSKNEKTVFLEKDMRKPLSKQEIKDLVKKAKQGNICQAEKNFKSKMESGLSLEEQKANSDRFYKSNQIRNEQTNIYSIQKEL